MSYFRLLNRRAANCATSAIVAHLNQADRYTRLPGLVEEMRGDKLKPAIPGFDLLNQVGNTGTLSILLGKPPCSVAEFQGAYEALVQKASVNEGSPGASVCNIYREGSECFYALKSFSLPGHWYSVGSLIGLLAQTLGGEASYTHGELTVWFGTGQIRVSEQGCWNSDIACYEPLDNGDVEKRATRFPDIRTNDRVLKALDILAAGEDARHAVNILAHTVAEGHVTQKEVHDNFLRKGGMLDESRRAFEKTRENLDDAYRTCCTILNNPDKNLVNRLVRAAVPQIMSFAEFQSTFGAPSQVSPSRQFRPETLRRWHTRITNCYERTRNADA